ncbi:MAG: CotH kinase family protein, partial [Pseudobutyrivibrio sp.]|nr:CotH kinase family protein [Pseudobutyrivibrio sp.]
MPSRRLWAFVLLFISICLIFVISFTQYSSVTISNWDTLFLSDKDYQSLSTSAGLQAAPLTTEIYFNDERLLYDQVDNTFYYSLIEDDTEAFSPVVEVADSSIRLTVYGNAITPESIAANIPLQIVLLQNNSVSISNLICTTLPIMNVDIDQDILTQGGYDDTYDILTDVPSSIYLYDNRADADDKNRSITCDSKIRRRGQTNAVHPSKSYRLSLLEDNSDLNGNKVKKNLLGLREDDDWILYSPYRDYEKVRNVFSMNLWYDSFSKDNEWNVENGTEYRFIELFI